LQANVNEDLGPAPGTSNLHRSLLARSAAPSVATGRVGSLLLPVPAVAGPVAAFWRDRHTTMAQYRS
jgi:hypothetical protein